MASVHPSDFRIHISSRRDSRESSVSYFPSRDHSISYSSSDSGKSLNMFSGKYQSLNSGGPPGMPPPPPSSGARPPGASPSTPLKPATSVAKTSSNTLWYILGALALVAVILVVVLVWKPWAKDTGTGTGSSPQVFPSGSATSTSSTGTGSGTGTGTGTGTTGGSSATATLTLTLTNTLSNTLTATLTQSSTTTDTNLGVLLPPASLTATVTGANSVQLNWPAAANAFNYTVYVYKTSDNSYVDVRTVSGLTTTFTNLLSGTSYHFFIYSTSSNSVNSTLATDAFATTSSAFPTGVAGLTLIDFTYERISISWSFSSGATSYLVAYSTSINGPFTTLSVPMVSFVAFPYIITGLSASTTYYIKVAAQNSTETGPYSNTLTVTTASVSVAKITGLAITGTTLDGSSSSVSLSWNADSAATQYDILVTPATGTPSSVSSVLTTRTVPSLVPGMSYTFQVRGFNPVGGYGAYSDPQSIVAAPLNVTPVSVMTISDVSCSSLLLTVTRPSDTLSASFWQLTITNTTDSTTTVRTIGSTSFPSFHIDGLLPAKAYSFNIRVLGSGGALGPASTANLTATTLTASVTQLIAGVACTQVTGPLRYNLTWTAMGALKYAVRYRITGASVWTNVPPASYPSTPPFNMYPTYISDTGYTYQIQVAAASSSNVIIGPWANTAVDPQGSGWVTFAPTDFISNFAITNNGGVLYASWNWSGFGIQWRLEVSAVNGTNRRTIADYNDGQPSSNNPIFELFLSTGIASGSSYNFYVTPQGGTVNTFSNILVP